jgi:hypothetical protein
LDAVGTKGLHVGIVDEADSPEVDDAEVGRGLLQGPDVQHLVHLALLFSLPANKFTISQKALKVLFPLPLTILVHVWHSIAQFGKIRFSI